MLAMSPAGVRKALRRCFSTLPMRKTVVEINSREYPSDEFTNVTPKILSYMNRDLHLQKRHPLSLVRQSIVDYFYGSYVGPRGRPVFSVFDRLPPIVSVEQNFDSLLVPSEHPSRSRSDCYYVNRSTLLRAHTTAHQRDLIKSGLDNFIVVGDVYRRDEIDSTHFPVFHQVDGVRSQTKEQLFPDRPDLEIFDRDRRESEPSKQACHTLEAVKVVEYQLKHALVGLIKRLFGENVDYRWVEAQFPFTHPSWELEIFYDDKWMEVLGCGVTRHEILAAAGSTDAIAFAFGLGLERLAMALYNVPDIRLFWSRDSGFLSQFEPKEPGRIVKYKPVSLYPQCTNDLSFWLPKEKREIDFSSNDFYDLVRDAGGDIIEQVRLVDSYADKKSGKTSLCYRIIYRHMEKTLTKEEVNLVHAKIEKAAVEVLGVTIR